MSADGSRTSVALPRSYDSVVTPWKEEKTRSLSHSSMDYRKKKQAHPRPFAHPFTQNLGNHPYSSVTVEK